MLRGNASVKLTDLFSVQRILSSILTPIPSKLSGILERDPEKIKVRRKEMGMEAATRLEQKEMREAKTVEHKIPESLLGIGVRI